MVDGRSCGIKLINMACRAQLRLHRAGAAPRDLVAVGRFCGALLGNGLSHQPLFTPQSLFKIFYNLINYAFYPVRRKTSLFMARM